MESSIDGKRLVELFKQACSITEAEQEALVQKAMDENPDLGASLAELLGQQGPVPTEPGSFAKKLEEQYGSEADPHISLEGESEGSDFTSEIVHRLAGRGDAYGRYKLRGEVARGGQGAILRVWDEDLRRNLAMKVVLGKAEASGETPHVDSKTLGRFLEEAQVTGQLDHPNIVPVHELGLDDQGQVYFTMKLVKGRDLKAVFGLVQESKEGWSQTRALNVLLKVCEAMAYAHSKGVIHRDLKPGNVMVGKYGEVYVMDWGLAHVMGREERKDLRIPEDDSISAVHTERRDSGDESPDLTLMTMDGDVLGTPAYMSPEQARGRLSDMGPHSDVYSAGAMLYHLLAGQMPFVVPGVPVNNHAIWRRVQEGPPKAIRELAPNAPKQLVAICEKAMEREPRSRYSDMQQLAEDLVAYQSFGSVSAYRPSLMGRIEHVWQRTHWTGKLAVLLFVFLWVAPLLLSRRALAWEAKYISGTVMVAGGAVMVVLALASLFTRRRSRLLGSLILSVPLVYSSGMVIFGTSTLEDVYHEQQYVLPFHVAVIPMQVEAQDRDIELEGEETPIDIDLNETEVSQTIVDALERGFVRATLLEYPADRSTLSRARQTGHWVQQAIAKEADLILEGTLVYDPDIHTSKNEKADVLVFSLGGPGTWYRNDRSYQFHVEITGHVYDVTAATRSQYGLDRDSQISRMEVVIQEASLDYLDRAAGGSYGGSLVWPSTDVESEGVRLRVEEQILEQIGEISVRRILDAPEELIRAQDIIDFYPDNERYVDKDGQRFLVVQVVLETDDVSELSSVSYGKNGGEPVEANWNEVSYDPGARQRTYEAWIPVGDNGSVQLMIAQNDRELSARTFTYKPPKVGTN